MENLKTKNVLISGASFAGLSTAYWMNKLGYKVTVIDISNGLKKGGTPVNVMGQTIDTIKDMGLFDQILKNRITMESMEFKNADNITERTVDIQDDHRKKNEEEYEVERDFLLHLVFDSVKDNTEFIFGESILSIRDQGERVSVNFRSGFERPFDLVFGCDGVHSAVRKLCFGPEEEFSHFLHTYFSITIVEKLLIPEYTNQMYNEPGKMVMLNAYNNKTDIVMCFSSDEQIAYDYRDEDQQRAIVRERFTGTGWRTPELLEELINSKTWYFDKLCQMKMPSWTKGRIALIGDAAYCASPAAGRGGSLAIDGAAALAAAFQKYSDNYELAFQYYNESFRPFIEEVQAGVIDFGLEMLIPRTEVAIRKRNLGELDF